MDSNDKELTRADYEYNELGEMLVAYDANNVTPTMTITKLNYEDDGIMVEGDETTGCGYVLYFDYGATIKTKSQKGRQGSTTTITVTYTGSQTNGDSNKEFEVKIVLESSQYQVGSQNIQVNAWNFEIYLTNQSDLIQDFSLEIGKGYN